VVNYDPLGVLSLRFAVTFAIMTPFVFLVQPWRGYRDWIAGGLLGVLGFLGYNWPNHMGAGLVPSAYASIIIATEPALIAFIVAARGATLNHNLWVGIALSLFGAMLPVSDELSSTLPGSLKGSLLIGLAALCWSFYSVLAKPIAGRMGAVQFALASAFGGACACSLIAPHAAWIVASELSVSDWMILTFAATMSTIAAAIGWAIAINVLGPGFTGPLLSLIPVIGLACGAGALGERLSGWAILAAVLTTVGVIVSMYPHSVPRQVGR
jgi:drug/metabolite transporter (DMT)-like permease